MEKVIVEVQLTQEQSPTPRYTLMPESSQDFHSIHQVPMVNSARTFFSRYVLLTTTCTMRHDLYFGFSIGCFFFKSVFKGTLTILDGSLFCKPGPLQVLRPFQFP